MRSLVAAALLVPALALANGRPPATNGVRFRPGDAQSIYVATTFGLLISHDDGCSFRWVCEQNIGYGGTFDPKYRIATDGAIFATTFSGLRVSRDGGCSFSTATIDLPVGDPGRIADIWIDAIDIGPTGEVWVATADGSKANNIYRSTDNGATFAPRGMQSSSIWWKSILVAPSRARRVYATGYQVAGTAPDGGQMKPTAHFRYSDDGGETWTASPLTNVAFATIPMVYAVGVDRDDPDVVLMNSAGANPPSGDRLYRSTDGGATWTEVATTTGPILDVAIAKDGRVVVATSGGSGELVSTDHGATFSPVANAPQLTCVGQRGDGAMYGCAANWEPDLKAVARSSDGRAWDRVFRFGELAGALACPPGTSQNGDCESQWPGVRDQFAANGVGSCVGPSESVPVPRPARSGGCCDAGPATPGQLGGLLVLIALGGGATLRRRRR